MRRASSLEALGPVIAELAAGSAAFLPVLVLDVDRAGHAAGVGEAYRAAAAAADRMLRIAFAGIDLTLDTVIITADHGHVAPGGHGGDEPGLGLALAATDLVRAWCSPPYLDVPPPFWMVVVPTLDLAAATCALATAIVIGLAVLRRAPTTTRVQ